MDLPQKIAVALGEEPVDLLLENGKLVNVFSGEIHDRVRCYPRRPSGGVRQVPRLAQQRTCRAATSVPA